MNTDDLFVVAHVHLWSQLLARQSRNWTVTLRPNGVQYDKIIAVKDLLEGDFNRHNAYLEFQLRRHHELISRTYYFPSNIAAAQGVRDPELEVGNSPTLDLNQSELYYLCFSVRIIFEIVSHNEYGSPEQREPNDTSEASCGLCLH